MSSASASTPANSRRLSRNCCRKPSSSELSRATPMIAKRAGRRWPRDRLVECRQQLPSREVARGAEDDEGRGPGVGSMRRPS